MDPLALADVWQISQGSLRTNLGGVSEAEALHAPASGGNCINWVAGHILAARDQLLQGWEVEPFLTPEQSTVYGRGSEPLDGAGEHAPLKHLKEGLITTIEHMHATLIALEPEALDRSVRPERFPMPVKHATWGTLLTFALFHESYHGGQIGILRRHAGHEGAIR